MYASGVLFRAPSAMEERAGRSLVVAGRQDLVGDHRGGIITIERRPFDTNLTCVVVDVDSDDVMPVLRDVTAHTHRCVQTAPTIPARLAIFIGWFVE